VSFSQGRISDGAMIADEDEIDDNEDNELACVMSSESQGE